MSAPGWPSSVMTLLLVGYLGLWFFAAHALAHHYLAGWPARVAVMASMVVGVWPVRHAVAPRVQWVLQVFGRLVLGALYFVVLGPVAVPQRLAADTLRRRPPQGGQGGWQARRPAVASLDAARLEG